jgi:hypothetical protein
MTARRAALLLATLLCAGATQDQTTLIIQQTDDDGRTLGSPQMITCAAAPCEARWQVQLASGPASLTASIQHVQSGVYLVLRAPPDLGNVVGFDAGYAGPVFLPFRDDTTAHARLTLILTGPDNQTFHRKITPDLVLDVRVLGIGGSK